MAKFVSDLKTQLPTVKVLVTDENSVIKTSIVTKEQLENLPELEAKIGDIDGILTRLNSGEGV